MLTMTNPYSVLGVSPTRTQTEIAHACRRDLRDDHPDIRSRQSNSQTDERWAQALEAYALLRGPHRSAAYDRAHPAHQDTGPVPMPVTHNDSAAAQPPLWPGPVCHFEVWAVRHRGYIFAHGFRSEPRHSYQRNG